MENKKDGTSNKRHTPGPWHQTLYFVDAAPTGRYRDDEGVARSIAQTFGPDSDANARLIAAAPGLLAITKRFHAFIGEACIAGVLNPEADDIENMLAEALAEINKAEGR